ncbi:MAG: hypothetical protein NZ571_10905, partial [Anaerolineae bacterium]|nr:hypothetical protein [Anaerolineae bacterium]
MTQKRAPLWLKITVIAVIATHLALVSSVIVIYANRTPTSDEWHSLMNSGVAIKTARGMLTLADLLVSYNGYRVPITLSLTALNAVALGYDPRLEMIVTAALLLVNLTLMIALTYHLLGDLAPRLFWLGAALLAVVIFTGRWWASWAWGLANFWQFTIAFTLLGMVIATRRSLGWCAFSISLLLCILAAFSHGAGILAFVVVGWLWLVHGERHWLRWSLFILAAILCASATFLGERQGFTTLSIDVLRNALFSILYLGSAQTILSSPRFSALSPLPQLIAALVFTVASALTAANLVFLWRRADRQKLALAFAFILWGLGFTATASIGRGALFKADELPAFLHHTPLQMQFWIGVLLISLLTIAQGRSRLRLANVLLIAFMCVTQLGFSALPTLYVISPAARLETTASTEYRECPLAVLIGDNRCDNYTPIIPRDMVRQSALGLAELRLGPFAHAEREPVPILLRFQPIQTEQTESGNAFRVATLNDQAQYVLFQRTARLLQSLA